jgi:hypothetical protein
MRKRVMPARPEEVVMRELQVAAVLQQPVQALAVVQGPPGQLLVAVHPHHPALLLELPQEAEQVPPETGKLVQ